jgi:GTPase
MENKLQITSPTPLPSNDLPHKAGFVAIIGKPNAGKSTLMNALLGEKLSIVTPKAQTTRHRIFGILNEENYQIVFSDTPGIIKPSYELHKSMMKFVSYSLEDADLVLCVIDANDDEIDEDIVLRLQNLQVPVCFVLNKLDLVSDLKLSALNQKCRAFPFQKEVMIVSALNKIHTSIVLDTILKYLPQHPAYYDKEALSDRPERFFASEIIREKIFLNYQQEIPYSCEVIITGFKEKPEINVVMAEIIVERDTQKGILIGQDGKSLKKLGTDARKEMELFFGKKVFLDTHIRVIKDWRSNQAYLKKFGYNMS